jgi:hypothetical protein
MQNSDLPNDSRTSSRITRLQVAPTSAKQVVKTFAKDTALASAGRGMSPGKQMNDGNTSRRSASMIRPGSLERDPSTGGKPETAALRNLGAHSGSGSLASRAWNGTW